MIDQITSDPAPAKASVPDKKAKSTDPSQGFLDLINAVPNQASKTKKPAQHIKDDSSQAKAKADNRTPGRKSLEKAEGKIPETGTAADTTLTTDISVTDPKEILAAGSAVGDPEEIMKLTRITNPLKKTAAEQAAIIAAKNTKSPRESSGHTARDNSPLAGSLEKLKLASMERPGSPGSTTAATDNAGPGAIQALSATTNSSLKDASSGIGKADFEKYAGMMNRTAAGAASKPADPTDTAKEPQTPALQELSGAPLQNRKTRNTNVSTEPQSVRARNRTESKNQTQNIEMQPDGKPRIQDNTASSGTGNPQAKPEKSADFGYIIEDTQSEKISSTGTDFKQASQTLAEKPFQAGPGAEAIRPSPRTAPPQPAVLQVSLQIEKAVAQGEQYFRISMKPAELGQVSVRLQIEGNRMKAYLSAERPETLDLLQRESRWLERALTATGIDITADNIQFSLEQDTGSTRHDDTPGQDDSFTGSGKFSDPGNQPEHSPQAISPTVGLIDVMI